MRSIALLVLAALLLVAVLLTVDRLTNEPRCNEGGGVVMAHCESR